MDEQERALFLRVAAAFRLYGQLSQQTVVSPVENAINVLNSDYQQFLRVLNDHREKLTQAVAANAAFCNSIADSIPGFIGMENNQQLTVAEPTPLDISKVSSVLRQLAREWSMDGHIERMQSFDIIINALCRCFQPNLRRNTRILVPGSGLGRLPFELSIAGFDVVGNECSPHMLVTSSLVFNSPSRNQVPLFPYIHSQSHWRQRADQLRHVLVPDINLSREVQSGKMSMGMGDFYELNTGSREQFQAIATCFFIDAPFNFFKTLDVITDLVDIGGYWVNLGPLHWHSENNDTETDEPILGLALEDVINLISQKGWHFLERQSALPTTYCSTHPNRMGRMVFNCEYWLAKRVN